MNYALLMVSVLKVIWFYTPYGEVIKQLKLNLNSSIQTYNIKAYKPCSYSIELNDDRQCIFVVGLSDKMCQGALLDLATRCADVPCWTCDKMCQFALLDLATRCADLPCWNLATRCRQDVLMCPVGLSDKMC